MSEKTAMMPFTAIVGMDAAKKALMCMMADRGIKGLLIRGPSGTAKDNIIVAETGSSIGKEGEVTATVTSGLGTSADNNIVFMYGKTYGNIYGGQAMKSTGTANRNLVYVGSGAQDGREAVVLAVRGVGDQHRGLGCVPRRTAYINIDGYAVAHRDGDIGAHLEPCHGSQPLTGRIRTPAALARLLTIGARYGLEAYLAR